MLWGIIRRDFDGMAVVAGKGCSCIGILADEVVIETPWDDGFIQHHRLSAGAEIDGLALYTIPDPIFLLTSPSMA